MRNFNKIIDIFENNNKNNNLYFILKNNKVTITEQINEKGEGIGDEVITDGYTVSSKYYNKNKDIEKIELELNKTVKTLNLIDFIHNNQDWENKLTSDPYNIKINRKDGYIIFNYKMGQTDFSFNKDLLMECRGIILDEMNDYKPVCVPFFKFFNYGEKCADNIDWDYTIAEEKIDGSLIKFWIGRDGDLRISTNGTIDARDAIVQNFNEKINFYDLVIEALGDNVDIILRQIKEIIKNNQTFICELVSPKNRIVVDYQETELYGLALRDNDSLFIEHYSCLKDTLSISLKAPKTYFISNLEEAIAYTKNMSYNEEGFVVSDIHGNKIKIKSEEYVKAHYQITNRFNSIKSLLKVIQEKEEDEVLVYKPELKEKFDEINEILYLYCESVRDTFDLIKEVLGDNYSQKEFAKHALFYKEASDLLFKLNKNEDIDLLEELWKKPIDKIERIVRSVDMHEL